MKNYVNFFYDLLAKIDKWDEEDYNSKSLILQNYFKNTKDISFFTDYFDKYWEFLLKSSFNSFLKGVINAVIEPLNLGLPCLSDPFKIFSHQKYLFKISLK